MGIFLVLCALACLLVIAWGIASDRVSGDGAGAIAFIFGVAAAILLAMAAININGSPHG